MIRRATLPLVLFASACLAADPTPEEMLKASLEKLTAAKAIHVKGAVARITAGDKKGASMEEDLWVGEGNRVRADVTFVNGDERQSRLFVSDGTTQGMLEGVSDERGPAAQGLSAALIKAFLHGGSAIVGEMLDALDKCDAATVTDVKAGGDAKVGDRDAVILELAYTLNVHGDDVILTSKLFLDKATMLPLRRESKDQEGMEIEEVYASIEIDVAAPEGTFTLPEPKPK